MMNTNPCTLCHISSLGCEPRSVLEHQLLRGVTTDVIWAEGGRLHVDMLSITSNCTRCHMQIRLIIY